MMVTFQSEGAEANNTSQICLCPPGDGDFLHVDPACVTGSLVAAEQTAAITSASPGTTPTPPRTHLSGGKNPSSPFESHSGQKQICKAFVSSKVSEGTKERPVTAKPY